MGPESIVDRRGYVVVSNSESAHSNHDWACVTGLCNPEWASAVINGIHAAPDPPVLRSNTTAR
jgi:hypothetical protein